MHWSDILLVLKNIHINYKKKTLMKTDLSAFTESFFDQLLRSQICRKVKRAACSKELSDTLWHSAGCCLLSSLS